MSHLGPIAELEVLRVLRDFEGRKQVREMPAQLFDDPENAVTADLNRRPRCRGYFPRVEPLPLVEEVAVHSVDHLRVLRHADFAAAQ